MIPLYVFLTLASIGYIFTKSSTVPQPARMAAPHRNEVPSMDTIYHSTHSDFVRRVEQAKAAKIFQQSLNPAGNVVGAVRNVTPPPKVVKSNLAGIDIPAAEFTHNNQTPFFGSKVRQNTNPDALAPIMERFTGGFDDSIWKNKRETTPLFKPTEQLHHVNGAPNQTDKIYDRYQPGNVRNNERPFEQVLVGPGLGQGYSAEPTGGFQQFDRDYYMPRNVDDLRVLTNPKETYEGRVVSGAGIGQRGQVGQMDKNRADTYFENSADRYFTTTGAEIAQAQRPDYEVKATNRFDTTTEYVGDAVAITNKAPKLDPLVRDTNRQQLEEFGFRNADLDNFGKGEFFDFGKETFDLPPNERDVTADRTYHGNIATATKALTAPLEDIFKNTRKEYTVQHPRQFGSLNPQFPDKITVKDPNDVARTTIKETNIHDTSTGQLRGPNKSVVYDPQEIAKRTIRETNGDVDVSLNISGGEYKGKAYDPDQKARTTHKETLVDEKRNGSIQGLERRNAGFEVTDYSAPTTQKEFLSTKDYIGQAGTGEKADGAYQVTEYTAPTTQKQFLSDKDHFGGAGAAEAKRPMSKEDMQNARVNVLKEGTLRGRAPTKESVKVAAGTENVTIKIKRIDADNVNPRAAGNNKDNIKNEMLSSQTAFNFTKQRNLTDIDHVERLDINTLSSLRTNPYAMQSFFDAS
jgi:hypothetical protein